MGGGGGGGGGEVVEGLIVIIAKKWSANFNFGFFLFEENLNFK